MPDYRSCRFCIYGFNGICTNTKCLFSGEENDKIKICGQFVLDNDEVEHYERYIKPHEQG